MAATIWMTLLMTGLVGIAMGFLIEQFHATGMVLTFFIGYKILGGHFKSTFKFLVKWFLFHKTKLLSKHVKIPVVLGMVTFVALLFYPVDYTIIGDCNLGASKTLLLRPLVSGEVSWFYKNDGEVVKAGDKILKINNINVDFDRRISSLSYQKAKQNLRKTIVDKPQRYNEMQKDLASKKRDLIQKQLEYDSLFLVYKNELNGDAILSCENQERITGSFVSAGDEICRLYSTKVLYTYIEVAEQDVAYISTGQDVSLKLHSDPEVNYTGKIKEIRPTGKGDPRSPSRKVYTALISIQNDGSLKPGMLGRAKIYGKEVSIWKYAIIKLAAAFRLDLFF